MASSGDSPVPRTSASERVFRQLIGGILNGRYGPGDKLPTQRALAAALTVLALIISSSLFVTLMTLGLETRSAIVEQLAKDTTVNSIAVTSTRTTATPFVCPTPLTTITSSTTGLCRPQIQPQRGWDG